MFLYPSESILAANCTGEQTSQQDLYNPGACLCTEQSNSAKRIVQAISLSLKTDPEPMGAAASVEIYLGWFHLVSEGQRPTLSDTNALSRQFGKKDESTYGVRQAG